MTVSWQQITAHYRQYQGDRRSVHALAALAERIAGSPLAAGLFGWTSHYDLCIVQNEVDYPNNGPLLRLSSVSKDQLEFRYEDTGIRAKQWHRTVDADDALPRLLGFLGQLRWFPSAVLESMGDKTVGSGRPRGPLPSRQSG